MKKIKKNKKNVVSFCSDLHYGIERSKKTSFMKRNTGILALILTMTATSVFAQDLQPTETKAVINMLVTSMSDVPSKGEKVSFTGKNSGEKLTGITDKDGKFQLLLKKGETYEVDMMSWEFDTTYADVPVPDMEGLITFNYLVKYELPVTYTLKNVFFDTGKSTLRPESNKALNNLVELLQNKQDISIELEGHTDNEGDDQMNMTLSQNRAKAVREYLVSKKIATGRITAVGYGETRPVASNDSPEGRQENRRTVVKIKN